MTERFPLRPFWFCLTLALAFSLGALGLVIVFDNLTQGLAPAAHQPLRPGGGIISLMVSGSLLALVYKWPRVCRLLSWTTPVTALVLCLLPHVITGAPQWLSISPAIFVITLLISISQLNAMADQPKPSVGLSCGAALVLLGIISLLSPWFHPLLQISVGSIQASNIVVSPLVSLVGFAMPRLSEIFHQRALDTSRVMITLGILGITVTLASWHLLRLQASHDLQQEADTLVDQVAASSSSDYANRLALIGRLAERWGHLDTTQSDSYWNHEVYSYFRDFPEIRGIALLNDIGTLSNTASRDREAGRSLNRFLDQPGVEDWLHHTTASNSVHSRIYTPQGQPPMMVVAAPVPESPALALTMINLRDVLAQLMFHQRNRLPVAFRANDQYLFDTAGGQLRERNPIAGRTVNPHHDITWEVAVYKPLDPATGNDFLLPPLILLTGVSLSFLMMLTHLYWRESERRSDSLQRHLEQEQRLRHTNERILNFSRDLLCTVDREGRFAMISPACEAIFGYSQAELAGKPADWLMLPEDRAETMELAQQLIDGERQQLRNFRNRHRHRDGHVVTMSWMVEWSREEKALFCLGRDITDELVAETLTREREQFFALSPDMFCIVDLNNHFFELNQGFVNALGFQREELLGTSYMELIFEDDKPKVIDAVKQMMDGQSIDNLHIRALDRQGKIHWLQLSAILSADDLIYVVGRDNTDDRETRLRLQESEALLRIAENAAHIGGWALDVESGEARWSDAVCEIHDLPTGSSPELSAALEYYHPDDRPVIEDAVRLCMETGIPFDEELRIRTARGRERWVRVIGHSIRDEEGNRSQLQGAMQDVTSARQAMEQIQRFAERQATIFESITDAFYTLDRNWRFIYVNSRSEEFLQRNREELLGLDIWTAFPDVCGTIIEERYRHAMATGESVSFEAYYPPVEEWFEISAYPSDEGLAVYYRSVTSRKRAEQKLHETMEELERSNRDLQDFAFVASHDLQEPLRKIQAFSDRLISRSEKLDDQEKDYLARMQSAAGRMQTLIQDLLSYSRVTTRANPLVSCDPNRILQEVLQDMETTISQEQAQIHIEPLPPLQGDASQIRQVLQNLLSNSVKFHQTGHPPEIFIYPDNATRDSWTLVFSDRGIGFEQRHADKLFHPFQRLHQRSQYQGTGIGMAIVKKILDRHGAQVAVESEPDKGTTFRIRFRRPG